MNASSLPGALAHLAGELERALVAAAGQPRVDVAHASAATARSRCRSSRIRDERRSAWKSDGRSRSAAASRRCAPRAAWASQSPHRARRSSAADAVRSSRRTRTSAPPLETSCWYERRARLAPRAAVEVVQHRSAPVALARWRQRARELGAERQMRRKHSARKRRPATSHPTDPSSPRRAPARRPELPRQAREQQEQQNGERQRLREHLAGDAEGLAHRHRRGRLVDAHQRDGQQPRSDDHVRQAAADSGCRGMRRTARSRRERRSPSDRAPSASRAASCPPSRSAAQCPHRRRSACDSRAARRAVRRTRACCAAISPASASA